MTVNVGTSDRVLRAVLGVVFLYLAFFSGLPLFATPMFKYGAALAGVVMLATSTMRMCPIYSILGLKSCKDC